MPRSDGYDSTVTPEAKAVEARRQLLNNTSEPRIMVAGASPGDDH